MRPAHLGHVLLLVLLGAASLSAGCRPRVTTPLLKTDACMQSLDDAFGNQTTAVIAMRAADGGSVWQPEVLAAVDRVCQAFEEEASDDYIGVKCLTSVPIMEPGKTMAKVRVMRDELPMDEETVRRFRAQTLQLEFARGDVLDATGELSTFIHLPMVSFEGVDVRAVFERVAGEEVSNLQMAIDRGVPSELSAYKRIGREGPSSSIVVGMFDAGEDGALKEPSVLQALARFQAAAESLPRVAQSFTIVDDLIMARRGLHKGNPVEGYIPGRRPEVAQLLLALSLNPAANAFGPRLDSAERVALVRVNLKPGTEQQRRRMLAALEPMLQGALPPKASAILCAQ